MGTKLRQADWLVMKPRGMTYWSSSLYLSSYLNSKHEFLFEYIDPTKNQDYIINVQEVRSGDFTYSLDIKFESILDLHEQGRSAWQLQYCGSTKLE